MTGGCIVDGCSVSGGRFIRGYCNAHYLRLRRNGALGKLVKPSFEDRFLGRIVRSGDCWVWTGAVGVNGYGRISREGLQVYAHRASWELHVGPIPEGLVIDHLCKNTLCVNPDHLEPVTNVVNVMRGDSPMARQARQTHCKNGHPFNEVNTRVTTQGKRSCRQCGHEYEVARRAAMKENAA